MHFSTKIERNIFSIAFLRVKINKRIYCIACNRRNIQWILRERKICRCVMYSVELCQCVFFYFLKLTIWNGTMLNLTCISNQFLPLLCLLCYFVPMRTRLWVYKLLYFVTMWILCWLLKQNNLFICFFYSFVWHILSPIYILSHFQNFSSRFFDRISSW